MGTKSPGEIIPVTSDGGHVILDACLSYIKFLMGSESKLAIQNVICAKFELDTLKTSREKLFKCVYPDKKYVYNGPKSTSTDAQKSVHALEGILTTLHQLDQTASSLIFACPSYQLESVMNSESQPAGDEIQRLRLCKIESDISDLKSMKVKMDDLQNTMIAMMTSSFKDQPSQPSLLPKNDREFPPIMRNRSSSVASNKRQRTNDSDSDISLDADGFQLPKNILKKNARAEKKSNSNPPSMNLFSDKLKNGKSKPEGTPKPKNMKKTFQWGKATDESSAGLQGVVPEIFVTKCNNNTEPSQIVNHLKEKGINVKNVERKSREGAYFKSFKISVSSQHEYDLVISGEPLPKGIQVRPWIYYKNNSPSSNVGSFKSAPGTSVNNASPNLNQELMELENLERYLSQQSATNVNTASSTEMIDTPVTTINHNG